jgi:hypothetical protein
MLIGDLAEYYGILDYKVLPPATLASLVVVLRPESRIMMHYGKIRITLSQMLMAQMIDALNILIWQNTKNGHKGRKRPESLYKALTENNLKEELETFEEPEDYLRWREQKGM